MSEASTLLLGLIAGATILLGLPFGRVQQSRPELRQFLNAVAIGILLFLLWDVLGQAWEPIDLAASDMHEGNGGLSRVIGYGLLFLLGLGAGMLSLHYYERWMRSRPNATRHVDPEESDPRSQAFPADLTSPRQLALIIAVGIGLHNFGEGLAIGASAATGEISLALILVIGFALHNATEGFGIVAPLSSEADPPSWTLLLMLGVIGGAPTFIGTIVGREFTSDAVTTAFLALAAGSIIFVIVQLLSAAHRMARHDLIYWGLLVGIAAGFATDVVVASGGA